MSIWWRRIFAACVAVAALASCTDKTGGKAESDGRVVTSTLTPDPIPDSSLVLSDDTVSCKLNGIQLKINGSTRGLEYGIIVVSRERDHVRIEWGGETTHVLIVNDKDWVFLRGKNGVTLLYNKDWKTPIKKLVLCPREHR